MTLLRLLPALLAPLLSATASHAQEPRPAEEINRIGILFPKTTFRDLLQVVGPLTGKKIRVADEADLKIETALNLPGPVTNGAVLKTISGLLALEGFELELAGAGKELELRRILNPEQVKVLREGLKLPATTRQEGPFPRERSVAGKVPESWIVIGPAEPPSGK